MAELKIYHNPRCSKSRQTLALLTEKGLAVEVILYLETPPSEAEISQLLTLLELSPRQLMRTKEALYKELELASEENEAALIKAMHLNPKLMERPIVVKGQQARIGRPPEQVLDIV